MVGIGVLVVASGAWLGSRVVTEWSRLREIDAGRREQSDIAQRVRQERRALREEIERTREELQEIPDSLTGKRSGLLMDRSLSIAKAEENLERDLLRARRRLRYLDGQRETVAGNLRRWSVVLAAVEAFLIGGAVLVVRWR